MITRLAWLGFWALLLGSVAAQALTDGLTPGHVRAIFSARGANPGAVFAADGRRYLLQSLSVENGGRHGEFVVRLKVEALAD